MKSLHDLITPDELLEQRMVEMIHATYCHYSDMNQYEMIYGQQVFHRHRSHIFMARRTLNPGRIFDVSTNGDIIPIPPITTFAGLNTEEPE